MKTPRRSNADSTGDEGRISRRLLLRQAGIASVLLALPWTASADTFLFPGDPKPPEIPFRPSRLGEGIVGPYGEVRILEVNNELLPIFTAASDDSAVMDMSNRVPFVRYGTGSNAITLSAAGIRFGLGRPVAWSADSLRRLVTDLSKDKIRARSVLLLRSALHTAYPVAVAKRSSLSTRKKAGKNRSAHAITKGTRGLGASSMKCSTTTVTETVTRTFTESVEVIRTAQEQFNECYDRELAQPLCAALPYGKEACALAACSVTAFVSMVVGFIEVITTIAEEVTREAVNCASRTRGEWTSPWITNAPVKGISLARGAPAPDPEFTSKDIIAGVKLLRELPEIFGPFGTCMLAGE